MNDCNLLIRLYKLSKLLGSRCRIMRILVTVSDMAGQIVAYFRGCLKRLKYTGIFLLLVRGSCGRVSCLTAKLNGIVACVLIEFFFCKPPVLLQSMKKIFFRLCRAVK